MDRELKNKVIIITGGAAGIGFCIAENFLEQGVKTVVILDINETKGYEAAQALNLKYGENSTDFIYCDITKDLEKVFNVIIDKYRTVDVLVNNAGIVDEDSIRNTIDVNTVAPIEWAMKFREHMRSDKGGHGGTIVNISSMYGFFIDAYMHFYKASKHAIMGFTRSLGHEDNYNKTSVRVVALCPGFTHTAMEENVTFEYYEEYVEYQAVHPWQTADEVAKAAVEMFKVADSGTAWMICGGKPIVKV